MNFTLDSIKKVAEELERHLKSRKDNPEPRRCSKCGVEKPETEFYRKNRGRSSICKVCTREQTRARYWADPEKARASRQARYWARERYGGSGA